MKKNQTVPSVLTALSGTIQVLIVPADTSLPMYVQDVEPTYDRYRLLMQSGRPQTIHGPGWAGWVDEYGTNLRLPKNGRATAMGQRLNQDGHGALAVFMFGQPAPLMGQVVFSGPPDEFGNHTSVPASVLDVAHTVGRMA